MVIIITDDIIITDEKSIMIDNDSPAIVEPRIRAMTGLINVFVETSVGLHLFKSQIYDE